jgi:hypothetical protein
MKRALLFTVAVAIVAAVAVAAARPPRVNPGAGIDRCDDDNGCTDVLTDPDSCCPICGRIVVTRKRRAEIERRCSKPDPRRHCHPAPCGAPRQVSPACIEGQCRDLNGG